MITSNQQLVHLLKQKMRYLNKKINESLRDHELFHAQWTILFCLFKFGPMTQTAIWQYLNVEAPTVTRTIKKLEENSWVIRKTGNDKRERIIQLREQSLPAVMEIERKMQKVEEQTLEGLSVQERADLKDLLQRIGTDRSERINYE